MCALLVFTDRGIHGRTLAGHGNVLGTEDTLERCEGGKTSLRGLGWREVIFLGFGFHWCFSCF